MKKYILSIDQGTTGTTALLVDSYSFKVIGEFGEDFKQHLPSPGKVEHDLHDIWKTVSNTVSGVLKKYNVSKEDIASIGITNQRETTCAFDKNGTPLHNAIVWQDRRTYEFCLTHKERYSSLAEKTGLPLDPYFSATKMNWLLENSTSVKNAQLQNNLCLSTIDSYVLFKLTAGKSFFTDSSNASRTLLFNLKTGEWDNELLSFFKIPLNVLPEIRDSFGNFGLTSGLDFLPDGIPVTCILGDQQAALFGQRCTKPGEMKITYGTGAFMLINTGEKPVFSKNGLLTTIAYSYNGKLTYALEGATYIAGAAVQWLRDNLHIIKNSADIEQLASEVTDLKEIESILFFPFFTGIASPYWISEARASIIGLSRDTRDKHIAYACLEGVALSINDLIETVQNDINDKILDLRVDGGVSANNFFLQLQSSILGFDITRPKNIETTAYGVAIGSIIGNGKMKFEELENIWEVDRSFSPNAQQVQFYENKKNIWKKLIKSLYLS